jgi:hypothetical protein
VLEDQEFHEKKEGGKYITQTLICRAATYRDVDKKAP